MKYPESSAESIKYADYLSNLHGEKFLPIERVDKINNKFAINFAAETEEELPHYLEGGWKLVDAGK